MIEAYGYKQQIINELNNINNDTNNFYNYKGLNFLSKMSSKNNNLVIIFHGAIHNSAIGKFNVVFRGFDYTIDNTDIICISDYLLTKYKDNYTVNWSLSTKKHANLDLLYKEVFEYIINMKKYKVLVVGVGNMGSAHAKAYNDIPEFELVGLVSNTAKRRSPLSKQLGGIAEFDNFEKALLEIKTLTPNEVKQLNEKNQCTLTPIICIYLNIFFC